MSKKYKFTGETKQVSGKILRRIRKLSNGVLGGFIEHESNLSHAGDCFVYHEAQVWGNARVEGNALVYNNAQVWGNAQVGGNAQVYRYAQVYGNAQVCGNARVWENAQVSDTPIFISGLRHNITITETHIFIGCEGHTIDYWRKEIVNIGKKHEYSDKEIKQVIKFIKAALRS